VIYLRKVSKYHRDAELGHEVVLRDASFVFPTDRPVVVLGPDARVISSIMLLLTGSMAPDKGEISRGRIRCSPLINSAGTPGAALLAQYTSADNIRRFAELYSVDRQKLMDSVENACSLGAYLNLPVKKMQWPMRRSLEAAIITALPFDCYFADRLHSLESGLVWRLFYAAKVRGAGIIYSAQRLPPGIRRSSTAAVAANGALQWADNTQGTITSHG
jgi:ABC-type polysaccharide/polyol phosphate transport system ATPase subunit